MGELALPGARQELCFPFMNKVILNFLTGEGFNLQRVGGGGVGLTQDLSVQP